MVTHTHTFIRRLLPVLALALLIPATASCASKKDDQRVASEHAARIARDIETFADLKAVAPQALSLQELQHAIKGQPQDRTVAIKVVNKLIQVTRGAAVRCIDPSTIDSGIAITEAFCPGS